MSLESVHQAVREGLAGNPLAGGDDVEFLPPQGHLSWALRTFLLIGSSQPGLWRITFIIQSQLNVDAYHIYQISSQQHLD